MDIKDDPMRVGDEDYQGMTSREEFIHEQNLDLARARYIERRTEDHAKLRTDVEIDVLLMEDCHVLELIRELSVLDRKDVIGYVTGSMRAIERFRQALDAQALKLAQEDADDALDGDILLELER